MTSPFTKNNAHLALKNFDAIREIVEANEGEISIEIDHSVFEKIRSFLVAAVEAAPEEAPCVDSNDGEWKHVATVPLEIDTTDPANGH